MMGGIGAHEYMAPCAAGENDVALSDAGYAANVEIASAEPQPVDGLPEPLAAPEEVETPGATTIEAVCGQLGVPAGRADQGVPGDTPRAAARCSWSCAATTASTRSSSRTRSARRSGRRRPRRCESDFGAEPGFIGPVGAPVPVLADEALRGLAGLVAGRQRAGHAPARRGARARLRARVGRRARAWRRATATRRAARSASSPRSRWATSSSSARATRSRSAPRYLDEDGQGAADLDGLVRHRARRASSPPRSSSSPTSRASRGRGRWRRSTWSWSRSASRGRRPRAVSDRLYDELRELGLDVLYDDRDDRARARSSPTPSCSAARCALTIGKRERRGAARSRSRCGAARRRARCRSRAPPRRPRSCGATLP